MPAIALLETQPRELQDLRVELAPVVDHDHDRRTTPQRVTHVRKHGGNPLHIGTQRCPARPLPELERPAVLEPEQLVGVAVLLVVVDQARIRRGGDHAVEAPPELELPRGPPPHARRAPTPPPPGRPPPPREGGHRVATEAAARPA